MFEIPELTPEYFEILVVRELRKVGLEVSALSLHRRSTQVHAEPGYLLELKGVVSRADWQRRALIGCRRQDALIGRAEIESFREHLTEAGVEAGIFFARRRLRRKPCTPPTTAHSPCFASRTGERRSTRAGGAHPVTTPPGSLLTAPSSSVATSRVSHTTGCSKPGRVT